MDKVRPGIGLTGLVREQEATGLPRTVPAARELSAQEVGTLEHIAALLRGDPFALLTGAGLSTDSGIPDYRGSGAAPRNPLTYQEFVGDTALRQRYWARNHVGWSQMHSAEPNAGHLAVAALERGGALTGVITQNVDRLHEQAGAHNVVDLHGRFDQVICLGCENTYSRSFLSIILEELNPGFLAAVTAAGGVSMAPDADADLDSEELLATFKVAKCPLCGGMLKPDFVFFGENAPKDKVARSFEIVDAAGALVVAGSSLTVMSGLRFAKKAARDGKPVIIINRGETRADSLAAVKLEAGISESMIHLTRALGIELA